MDRSIVSAQALNDVKCHRFRWTAIFMLKISFWAAWIGLCIYGLWITGSPWTALLLQALLGAAYAHGVELQHQALHQSGFQSRRLSRLFGVLLGMPMLVSYSAYQDNHLFHHKKLGTHEDTEFFEYGDKSDKNIFAIFKHFFLINHFCDFLKNSIDAFNWRLFKTRLLARNSVKIRFEYILMALMFFGVAAISSRLNSNLFIKLWLMPLFLFAAPIHALIELPEHFKCNKDTQDVFENTRTIKSHPFMTWFTNGNNYHVEHHWVASLPIEKLALIHPQIADRIVYLSPSYWSFYRSFFTELLFKSSTRKSVAPSDGR
jgi:fatty acid desaturase